MFASILIPNGYYGKSSDDADLLIRALDKLAADGYLNRDGTNSNYFNISGEGHDFIENGGYKVFVEKINNKEETQGLIEQPILKTNNSSISTNKSVRETNEIQKKSIKSNGRLFWVTLAVAIAGASASWMQVINDSEKNDLKRTLKDKDSLLLQKEYNILQKDRTLSAQRSLIDSLQSALSDTSKK